MQARTMRCFKANTEYIYKLFFHYNSDRLKKINSLASALHGRHNYVHIDLTERSDDG